jgi:hypothetical protein
MTKLEQLEKTVSELEAADFAAFAAWFEALQADRWDRQFGEDAAAEKLQRLGAEAQADFKSGTTTRL